MPRCARAVSLTGYYHVFDRGNSKQIIFEDDSDRYRFLSDISDRFARHKVAVLAWCLMDNHFQEVAGRIWAMEVLPRRRIPDEEALSVAREVLPSIDPALLKALPRPDRDACLLRLRRAHLTVKQIARITGIGATSVTKATAGWYEAA